jgi:hypothetical protein
MTDVMVFPNRLLPLLNLESGRVQRRGSSIFTQIGCLGCRRSGHLVSYLLSACSVTFDGKESFRSAGKYCTFVALGQLNRIFKKTTAL